MKLKPYINEVIEHLYFPQRYAYWPRSHVLMPRRPSLFLISQAALPRHRYSIVHLSPACSAARHSVLFQPCRRHPPSTNKNDRYHTTNTHITTCLTSCLSQCVNSHLLALQNEEPAPNSYQSQICNARHPLTCHPLALLHTQSKPSDANQGRLEPLLK